MINLLGLLFGVLWFFLPWVGFVILAFLVYLVLQTRSVGRQAAVRVVQLYEEGKFQLSLEEWEYFTRHALFFLFPLMTRFTGSAASAIGVWTGILAVFLAFSGRWLDVALAILVLLVCMPLVNLNHPFLAAKRALAAEEQGRLGDEWIERLRYDRIVAELNSGNVEMREVWDSNQRG